MTKSKDPAAASMSKKNEEANHLKVKATGNVDDNATDTTENECTSTENRDSENDDGAHDLKVSAATTLLGTATQQQAEDSSPQSHMLSLLSHAWQQERHTQNTEAPSLNRALPLNNHQHHQTIDAAQLSTVAGNRPLGQNEPPSPLHQSTIWLAMNNSHNRSGLSPPLNGALPLNNHQHHTIDAGQLATVTGIRQFGLNDPSSLHQHQSFLGHTQRPLGLNEPSTLPQSLFGHSQLTMNNSHNRPEFPFVSQLSSTQASMPMPPSLLEQIQQALTTNQNLSSGNPLAHQVTMMAGGSATQAMVRAHLLQQISLSQNPSYLPSAFYDQYQSQMLQIQEYIRIREHVSALLLMQQQTTAATPATANTPDFNSNNSMMMQGHPAMAMMHSQNPMQQGGPHSMAMSAAAAAAAPAFNPTHPTSSLNGNNMMFDAPSLAAASQATTVAPQRSTNTPSHEAKEKRWLIRYEELREFHTKHGHCRVPHGYAQNRKLSWWVMNQRAQYQLLRQGKPSWLSHDRIRLMDSLGFDWNPIIGKS